MRPFHLTSCRTLGIAAVLAGLTSAAPAPPVRPAFHFTPPAGWMNDPNGLVYRDGTYHLYYQFNPAATVWGPMHWGHATSRDLIHWTPQPVALTPDEQGTIFSGSAVTDIANTAGFGAGAMVAVYTQNQPDRQAQALASSTDQGVTWTKYAGNPVLTPPNGLRNFRDPKVFRYGGADGHWVMLVAAGSAVLTYTSPDLKAWTPAGGFGFGAGATCGVWETPELTQLPVDGGPGTRWVLSVGVGDCAPAGGSGVQYFVGRFDGRTFISDNPRAAVLWADRGADFYAAQAWNDAPGGRHVWAAWMNNWRYAGQVPATTFRGALTFPREVGLTRTPQGLRLTQQPAREIEALRGQHWNARNLRVNGTVPLRGASGELRDLTVTFRPGPTPAARFGLRVRAGPESGTRIGYATREAQLFIDRSRSGQVAFNAAFPAVHTAPLPLTGGAVTLRVLIDRTSVEVFSGDGTLVMTDSIFPGADDVNLELFSEGGGVTVTALDIYALTP